MNPTVHENLILGATEVEISERYYLFDSREKTLMLFPEGDNRL